MEYFVLGVPVYRLRFRSKVSDETIKKFFRVIRKLLSIAEECSEPFTGEIECDETMFGGKRKGKRGWGAGGKFLILGILQRDGKVRTFPVKGRSAQRLIPVISKVTKPGSLYYTDDWHAYASLGLRGNHVVVRKEKGRPKGRNHLNGIEGFWSYAKNWLYQYRGVPKKFFHFYLGEISFRFNHRHEDLFPTILKILKQTEYDKNLVRIV
ncbi:MAG: IS1595 family transposase [Candidatus Ratteibacteria bacterium]